MNPSQNRQTQERGNGVPVDIVRAAAAVARCFSPLWITDTPPPKIAARPVARLAFAPIPNLTMNISQRLFALFTSTCLLAALLSAQPAESKSAPAGRGKGKAAKEGERPRDQTPSWRMPPVQGANLHYKTFDSKLAGEKVSYLLYLPPGYETSGNKRYPVVYWLHGIGGGQQGVPQMAERMTKAIEEQKMPATIFVYVNGMIRSSYVDSADGKTPVESVSIKELIPHVDATYRTIATRAGRMIEGFSMGGAGAAKWGFKFPDAFGSISIIDGALSTSAEPDARKMDSMKTVYGGDVERYKASNPVVLAPKNAAKVKGRTAIRIVTRTAGLANANEKFSELLTQLGLEHEFYKIPDAPHSPNPLYEGLGERNWPFYAKAFKAALGPK